MKQDWCLANLEFLTIRFLKEKYHFEVISLRVVQFIDLVAHGEVSGRLTGSLRRVPSASLKGSKCFMGNREFLDIWEA